jgi:hypothetical protein
MCVCVTERERESVRVRGKGRERELEHVSIPPGSTDLLAFAARIFPLYLQVQVRTCARVCTHIRALDQYSNHNFLHI